WRLRPPRSWRSFQSRAGCGPLLYWGGCWTWPSNPPCGVGRRRVLGSVLCLDINARKGQFRFMDHEPLHRRIAGDIERRIASGEWRPGFRIPTEAELMAEYGCARMTVSRAVSALSARGLVVRRRRAGTVVAHPPVHSSALVAIPDIQSEVEGRGLAYSHRLLGRIVRPAGEDDEGLGERVIELQTLHLADDLPFVFERRLISLTAAPE